MSKTAIIAITGMAALVAGVSAIPGRRFYRREQGKRPVGFAKCIKIIVLYPFILLVRAAAKLDPHLFRYWAVDSIHYWRDWPQYWKAYAISLAIWAIVIGVLYDLVRWLW